MEILWEQPSEAVVLRSRGRNGRYVDFAVALKNATPPEGSEGWALLPADAGRTDKGAKGTAQNIRLGKVGGFTKGEFEAVSDGTKVYVRYVGKAEQPEQPEDADSAEPDDEEDEPPAGEPMAPKIRAWARSKGIEVGDAGRLPRDLIDRYFRDTGEERPAGLRAV